MADQGYYLSQYYRATNSPSAWYSYNIKYVTADGREPEPSPNIQPTNEWIQKYGVKCERKYQERMARKQSSEEGGSVINKFMLGCDPEFVALDTNGRTMTLNLNEEEIGIDHGGRVGEFRPKPTKGAFALTRKLQKLILSSSIERIKASRLRAGARANEESLGGHIHFGLKKPGITLDYELDSRGRYIPDPAHPGNLKVKETGDDIIIRALDKVTNLLEHLDILPQQESYNRRRGSYGKFGDVRDSNGHFEYRSMCSWLYDPKVAYLCLTAAKIAVADPKGTLDALNRITSFGGLQKWLENYKEKDSNANRALEKIREHRVVQVSPDVDFRERWRTLGL